MINDKEIDHIMNQIKKLMIQKNKTYGDNNIIEMGEQGVMFRLSDKMIRLKNIVMNKVKTPEDETLEDTYLDIAGYAIIGLMLKRKKFQK